MHKLPEVIGMSGVFNGYRIFAILDSPKLQLCSGPAGFLRFCSVLGRLPVLLIPLHKIRRPEEALTAPQLLRLAQEHGKVFGFQRIALMIPIGNLRIIVASVAGVGDDLFPYFIIIDQILRHLKLCAKISLLILCQALPNLRELLQKTLHLPGLLRDPFQI